MAQTGFGLSDQWHFTCAMFDNDKRLSHICGVELNDQSEIAAIGGTAAMGCEKGAAESVHSVNTRIAERQNIMEGKVTAVTAKVISQKGTCGFGHKVGDTARITEAGVEGRICIHALYSMFPAAFAMLYDVKFPWLSDTDRKTHPCTDAQNPVVFELTKVRT